MWLSATRLQVTEGVAVHGGGMGTLHYVLVGWEISNHTKDEAAVNIYVVISHSTEHRTKVFIWMPHKEVTLTMMLPMGMHASQIKHD